MGWILKKKRNGSSRLTEAASFSVIIWDKGFTRPVEAQTIKEEETVVSSSFSAPETLQDFADEIKSISTWPDEEKADSAGKGFGK